MQKVIGECCWDPHLERSEGSRTSQREKARFDVSTAKATATLWGSLELGEPFRVVLDWGEGPRPVYSHIHSH